MLFVIDTIQLLTGAKRRNWVIEAWWKMSAHLQGPTNFTEWPNVGINRTVRDLFHLRSQSTKEVILAEVGRSVRSHAIYGTGWITQTVLLIRKMGGD